MKVLRLIALALGCAAVLSAAVQADSLSSIAQRRVLAGGGLVDKAKHSPQMDSSRGELGSVGSCERSVFEKKIVFSAILDNSITFPVPDQLNRRLNSVPVKHPSKNICGSYAGKDSCCTAEVLKDFQDWSDAADRAVESFAYAFERIRRDPGAILDVILGVVRSGIPAEEAKDIIDWKRIRKQYRENVGRIYLHIWENLYTPIKTFWVKYLTYQEGMLCSSCEPNFARFMHENHSVLMEEDAAAELGDAFVGVINSLDTFLSNPEEIKLIKSLAKEVCETETNEKLKCAAVPGAIDMGLSYFVGDKLRMLICEPTTHASVESKNTQCKRLIMDKILHGLGVDVTPIVDNAFTYIMSICKRFPGTNCKDIEIVQKSIIEWISFSFDDRPLGTNFYAKGGFNVAGAACRSNLSGFGCGGDGPEPNSHKSDEAPTKSSSNAGVIFLIIILIIMGLAGVGGALWVYRQRVAGIASRFYTRMADDGQGPTVGLV